MTDDTTKTTHPVLIFWVIAGWVGFCLLPWYMVDGGLWSFEWLLDGYPFDEDYAPAAFLIGQGEKLVACAASYCAPAATAGVKTRQIRSALCAHSDPVRGAGLRLADRTRVQHRNPRLQFRLAGSLVSESSGIGSSAWAMAR